jgi:hypothetical protein
MLFLAFKLYLENRYIFYKFIQMVDGKIEALSRVHFLSVHVDD